MTCFLRLGLPVFYLLRLSLVLCLSVLIENVLYRFQLLRLCYRVIKHAIREYRPNEIYASQWLELFLEQAIQSSDLNDIYAEPTLTELIDNNEKILQRIRPETMRRFFGILETNGLRSKYVTLLRALIICNGKRIEKNQETLSNILFERDQYLKKLLIPSCQLNSTTKNPEIFLYDKWIDFSRFYQNSYTKDDLLMFEYFNNLIHFLADLCLDRNFKAINPLLEMFPYEICFSIFKHSETETPTKNAFVRLLHHLHVNASISSLQVPNFVRYWEDVSMETSNEILESSAIASKFEGLKDFLIDYLKKRESINFNRAFHVDSNLLTLSVIDLLKLTLSIGCFTNLVELEILVRTLVSIVNGTLDVTNTEEEAMIDAMLTTNSKKMTWNFRVFNQNDIEKINAAGSSGLFGVPSGAMKESLSPAESFHSFKRLDSKESRANDAINLNQFAKKKIKMNSRYMATPDNLVLMNMKIKILETIRVLMRIKYNYWISSILVFMKKGHEADLFSDFSSNATNSHSIFAKNSQSRHLKHAARDSGEEYTLVDMMNRVISDKSFEMPQTGRSNLNLLLLDLLLYKNESLNNIALQVLIETHSKRETLFTMLKQLVIVETEATTALTRNLTEIGFFLQEKADKIELWLQEHSEVSQFIHKLDELTTLFSSSTPGDDLPKNLDDEEDPVINFGNMSVDLKEKIEEDGNKHTEYLDFEVFKENEVLNEYALKVIMSTEVFQGAITLVTYELSTAHTMVAKDMIHGHYNYLVRKTNNVLTKLCRGSSLIRDALTQYVDVFFNMLEHKKKNTNAHLVLAELFRNNRTFLYNTELLTKYLHIATKKIDTLFESDQSPYLRASILDSICVVCNIKKKTIKQNQTLLLEILTNKRFPNIIPAVDDKNFVNELLETNSKFQKSIENMNDVKDVLPASICYICAWLKVLSVVSEEKNAATESKAQNLVPLPIILLILQNSTNIYLLRNHVILFYYHVYMDTEKRSSEDTKLCNKITHIMINDFERLSEVFSNHKENLVFTHVGSTTRGSIQTKYLIDVLTPSLTLSMSRLYMMVKKEEAKSYLVSLMNGIRNVQDKVSRIEQREVLARFINSLYGLNIEEFEELSEMIDQDLREMELEKPGFHRFNAVPKMTEAFTSSPTITHMPENNFAKRQRQIDRMIHEITELAPRPRRSNKPKRRNSRRRASKLEEKIKQHHEKTSHEFDELVQLLFEVEHRSKTAFKDSCTLTIHEIARSLVSLISSSFDPAEEGEHMDDSMKLTVVKIFRKLIEQVNTGTEESSSNWKPEDWTDFEKQVRERQDLLVNIGVVPMICTILQNTENRKIIKETFMLSVAILIGGFAKAQEAFHKSFSEDIDNTILGKIEDLIQDMFESVKRMISFMNSKYEEILEEQMAKKEKSWGFVHAMDLTAIYKTKVASDIFDKEDFQFELENLELLRIIFRFLQLLCEGHNSKMQGYLREQDNDGLLNAKSINFIEKAAQLFGAHITIINKPMMEFSAQLIDFIVESIQGPCFKNQQTLVESKIIEFVKEFTHFSPQTFLKRGFETPDEQKSIKDLATSSFKILINLVEGNEDATIYSSLAETLDLRFLITMIVVEYERYVQEEIGLPVTAKLTQVNKLLKPFSFSETFLDSFNLYILLQEMIYYRPNLLGRLPIQDREQRAFAFYAYHTGKIEIIFKKNPTYVMFPILPENRFLSDDTKKRFMITVNRETNNDKMIGFISYAPRFFDELLYNAYLSTKFFHFTAKRMNYFRDFSTLIAFLVNLIILITFDREIENEVSVHSYGDAIFDVDFTSTLYIVLGVLQLIASCIMLVFWLVINMKPNMTHYWRVRFRNMKKELSIIYQDKRKQSTLELIGLISKKDVRFLSYSEQIKIFKLYHQEKLINFPMTRIIYLTESLLCLLRDNSFMYMLFYIMISLIGFFINEMWYSLHLLDIIARLDTLKNVIRSVTTNIATLISTGVLGFILMYIYSLVAYMFLSEDIISQDVLQMDGSIERENLCQSAIQCYMGVLNSGVRLGGGIAEMLPLSTFAEGNKTRYIIRFIYDLSFFAIINVIFLNIIFGIIIDTFAELRDKKTKMIVDKNSVCYVCGLERYLFDKNADGFDVHITKDHFLWNYLYFMYGLLTKDHTDHNGIESYVHQMIINEELSWFPMLQAKVLGQENKSIKDQIFEELRSISDKLDQVIAEKDKAYA